MKCIDLKERGIGFVFSIPEAMGVIDILHWKFVQNKSLSKNEEFVKRANARFLSSAELTMRDTMIERMYYVNEFIHTAWMKATLNMMISLKFRPEMVDISLLSEQMEIGCNTYKEIFIKGSFHHAMLIFRMLRWFDSTDFNGENNLVAQKTVAFARFLNDHLTALIAEHV